MNFALRAGRLSLSWSDLLSWGRWEPVAGFAETSIAAAANTGAGPGAPTPQTDQSPVYIHTVYMRVLLTYANQVLSCSLGRFCLKS